MGDRARKDRRRQQEGVEHVQQAKSSARAHLESQVHGLPYHDQVEALRPPVPTTPVQMSRSVQKEEGDSGGGAGGSQKDRYLEAAKTAAQAWLKTETGERLKKQAMDWAFSEQGLPFTVTAGTAALAAMVANEMDLPIGSLKLDVALATVGNQKFTLELKPIWQGPLTNPSEYGGMVTLKISDFIKEDTGPEPGRPGKTRALFVFEGRLETPDGKPPDGNDLVVLLDGSGRPVKKQMTFPGRGTYTIDWWATPWNEDRNFKLVVIPGAGGPTRYRKVTLSFNLNDYYNANRHPQTIPNIIRLEELPNGTQTMYFEYVG